MDFDKAYRLSRSLKTNLESIIRGKQDVIELAITALLSRGHLLIEDVPGVGKTTLAHGLAKSVNCSFQRIQFTSDLLPSDVIGVTVFNQSAQSFEFRPGPVFANIVLADEINRTTPKTQSALLEAMNDRQVSVEKATYKLPEPFMLLATQNPVEYSGTFPLPESQLDRFIMCISMGYPDEAHEREILTSKASKLSPDSLKPVLSAEELIEMQKLAESVKVDDDLVTYILALAKATREHKGAQLGVSPRGTMALYRAAQSRALISGRDYCVPDDMKTLAKPVFAHRIVPVWQAEGRSAGESSILDEILSQTTVPA